jgi:exodeoxyribonuclease VII small subunit
VAKKKPSSEEDALSFEQSLAELEQLVAKLEGGKLGLSDALGAYELGVQRLNSCYQMLQHAERRIELVQSVDARGAAKTSPLDDADDGDLAEKSAARGRRRSASSARPNDDAGLF